MHCETGTDILRAAGWLKKGETVGIPTETVYGLAADATRAEAVVKIFSVKNRPSFDPLIVHVASFEQVETFADVNEVALKLMQLFWPGPLTILLPKKSIIPDVVTSGLPTVGVRMPDHPLTLELLKSIPFPLAAPSANPFGYISPTTARHVMDQLGDKIPYVLDGGPSRVGVESTIVMPMDGRLIVYRVGGVSLEQLHDAGFETELLKDHSTGLVAPGMLDSHYAPAKPLYFGTAESLAPYLSENATVLCLKRNHLFSGHEVDFLELSATGDLKEAAAGLFSAMRELDQSSCDSILAVEFPDVGLGRAINDRLRRAAVKRKV